MADHPPFRGFSEQALGFLGGLGVENTRAYFEARRSVYDDEVVAPARALVVDLGAVVRSAVSAGLQADPRIGKSLFRINRDLRFSKDKTPYNPWIDMVFWEGSDPRRAPSLILRIGVDYVVTGAGIMGMRDATLERYRSAVFAESTGLHLAMLVDDIRRNVPGTEVTEPRLTRIPPGYPADHARAVLLRCDTLYASVREAAPPEIRSAQFIDWLRRRYQSFAPLHRWLVDVTSSPS